jgi:hypothetical protein
VSETSVHIKWRGDENLKELGEEDLRLQSERLTKTYALGLHEGVQALFYFMLPHYTESKLQYGLLRPDLTPRPGYVALAAIGRLLADAKPLGRVKMKDENVQGFLFDARPDGQQADVLVAWSDTGGKIELAKPPQACFDHLGRTRALTNGVLSLTRAPFFAVLAKNARPELIPPPSPAKRLAGKPAPLVIQALLSEEDTVLDKSAFKISVGEMKTIPVFLYNFGSKNAAGRLRVKAPARWIAELPGKIDLAPGERKELKLNLTCGDTSDKSVAGVCITAKFGSAGQSLLALQFVPSN